MTRIARVIAFASLANCLGLIFSVPRAEAGLALGIVVEQPILVPTEDPTIQYEVRLTLNPGSALAVSLDNPDSSSSVTISGLMFLSGLYSYVAPTGQNFGLPKPHDPFQVDITASSGSVTLTYSDYNPNYSPLVATTSPIALGTFYFGTNLTYPVAGLVPDYVQSGINNITNSHLSYSSMTDGVTESGMDNGKAASHSGVTANVEPPVVTPEPGAVVLILSGMPVAIWYYRRRARAVA